MVRFADECVEGSEVSGTWRWIEVLIVMFGGEGGGGEGGGDGQGGEGGWMPPMKGWDMICGAKLALVHMEEGEGAPC